MEGHKVTQKKLQIFVTAAFVPLLEFVDQATKHSKNLLIREEIINE